MAKSATEIRCGLLENCRLARALVATIDDKPFDIPKIAALRENAIQAITAVMSEIAETPLNEIRVTTIDWDGEAEETLGYLIEPATSNLDKALWVTMVFTDVGKAIGRSFGYEIRAVYGMLNLLEAVARPSEIPRWERAVEKNVQADDTD